MTDAETEMQRAGDKLRSLASDSVSPVSGRNDAERRYAVAYQRLVRMGKRPQIRAKYRAGV